MTTPRRVQAVGGYLRSRETHGWLDGLPATASCGFCPGLSFSDSAAECVAWNRAHRAAAHPGLRSVTVRERQLAAKRHGYAKVAEFTAKDIAAIPVGDGKFRVSRCKIVGEKDVAEYGLGVAAVEAAA